jgi:D-alanyl-D-alanine carboxypeptidase (penicillin-binding protein 5/6)
LDPRRRTTILNRQELAMPLRLLVACCLVSIVVCRGLAQDASPEPPRQPADALDGPPLTTAKAWVIGDGSTGQRLWGSDDASPRAIASTTKIMTAWVVLALAEKDKTLLDQTVTISERADKTSGSTAGVLAGEKLPARELLYGLLLPSGNDAATALSEHFGRVLLNESDDEADGAECTEAFVAQMNRTAQALTMIETHYLDPHGLGSNRSSARDLLKLVHTAMQNESFRRYVQTRHHQGKLTTPEGGTREANWKNTNQALGIEGFDGVKTGTTNAAGACLVSSCRRGDDHLYVVVLGAATGDGRYVDTRNLLRWAWLQRKQ